jgi:hypothetical protein
MITKEELKDWLAESDRKKYTKEIEEYIDKFIKSNALRGNMTFFISTGDYTRDGSKKTRFYNLWYTKSLSEENRRFVQDKVINKYREFGFDVEKTTVDCGWSNHYFALKFSNIDKVIEEEAHSCEKNGKN